MCQKCFILSILRQTICLPHESTLSTDDLLIVSSFRTALGFSPVRKRFVDIILIFIASILFEALSVADYFSQNLSYDDSQSASSSESAVWDQADCCTSFSLPLDICPWSLSLSFDTTKTQKFAAVAHVPCKEWSKIIREP